MILLKIIDKAKWVYSGQRIAFYGTGSWSLGNDFARYVTTFVVDNISSSHSDNRKNNFLVLCEGPNYDINWSFSSPEKNFSINFSKANIKFLLTLHCNGDNSSLFVSKK